MTELRRALGLPTLTLYGLGTILGAGIYSVVGAAAGRAGRGVWLAFLVSAAVALVTALSYAELATAFPRAGAEYVYLRRALPRRRAVPFATGFLIAASSAATAGTVALAFAGYLGQLLRVPRLPVAAALLAALTALAVAGIRQSAWMNAVFTLVETGGLLLVIVVGASAEGFGRALEVPPAADLLGGAALVFFAYLGFENIANLAEEARAPERDLPRALLLSLGGATLLYVLVALAAVALLDPERLARSEAPLADAVATASPRLSGLLAAIALFATANTALVSLLAGSRVLYGMAKGGDLPARAAAVLERRRTPWVATLVVAAAAAALLPLGEVPVVAGVSSFAALAAFTAVNVAVVVLRYREPGLERPFRVPLAVGRFPVVPALGAAVTAALVAQIERTALVVGGLLVLLSLLAFLVLGRRGPRAAEDDARW